MYRIACSRGGSHLKSYSGWISSECSLGGYHPVSEWNYPNSVTEYGTPIDQFELMFVGLLSMGLGVVIGLVLH